MFYILCFITLCFSFQTQTMEQKQITSVDTLRHETHAINSWKEIEPFVGTVVAYTATTYYLTSKDYKYLLPQSSYSYGFVEKRLMDWRNTGKGYHLAQLLKKDSIGGVTALSDKFIQEGNLCIRNITSQEAEEIMQAIIAEKARFCCSTGDTRENILSVLQSITQK